jgi:hypothetical protein
VRVRRPPVLFVGVEECDVGELAVGGDGEAEGLIRGQDRHVELVGDLRGGQRVFAWLGAKCAGEGVDAALLAGVGGDAHGGPLAGVVWYV